MFLFEKLTDRHHNEFVKVDFDCFISLLHNRHDLLLSGKFFARFKHFLLLDAQSVHLGLHALAAQRGSEKARVVVKLLLNAVPGHLIVDNARTSSAALSSRSVKPIKDICSSLDLDGLSTDLRWCGYDTALILH